MNLLAFMGLGTMLSVVAGLVGYALFWALQPPVSKARREKIATDLPPSIARLVSPPLVPGGQNNSQTLLGHLYPFAAKPDSES